MKLVYKIVLFVNIFLFFTMAGCQTSTLHHVKVNRHSDTLFDQIRRNPNRHKGKVILVGGEVQGLRYQEWATVVEFSKIPLENEIHPVLDIAPGERFYVVFPERLDKFLYRKGKLVTIAGRIVGTRTVNGEDYPLLAHKEVQVWDRLRQDRFVSFGAFIGQF